MTMFIKPANDKIKVRKENGQLLAIEGETVQNNSYYQRRIKDGDVVIAKAPKAANKTPAKETK